MTKNSDKADTHTDYQRNVVLELTKENFDVTKRLISLIFTANAGAIVAIPAFLGGKEDVWSLGLMFPIVIFVIGVILCIYAFWFLSEALKHTAFQFSYNENSESHKQGKGFANEDNVKTRRFIKLSIVSFILGCVLSSLMVSFRYSPPFIIKCELSVPDEQVKGLSYLTTSKEEKVESVSASINVFSSDFVESVSASDIISATKKIKNEKNDASN